MMGPLNKYSLSPNTCRRLARIGCCFRIIYLVVCNILLASGESFDYWLAYVNIHLFLPIQPVFLLLVFGYKLIKQSNFVQLHEMDFRRAEIEVPKDEIPPSNIFGKLLNLLVWHVMGLPTLNGRTEFLLNNSLFRAFILYDFSLALHMFINGILAIIISVF